MIIETEPGNFCGYLASRKGPTVFLWGMRGGSLNEGPQTYRHDDGPMRAGETAKPLLYGDQDLVHGDGSSRRFQRMPRGSREQRADRKLRLRSAFRGEVLGEKCGLGLRRFGRIPGAFIHGMTGEVGDKPGVAVALDANLIGEVGVEA
ncbi:hypothetical protein APED_26230 [Acanthopleuribacter pedis]